MANQADLRAIETLDPNGGSAQPTTRELDAFESWAVRQYGQSTWDVYSAGGWAPGVEV